MMRPKQNFCLCIGIWLLQHNINCACSLAAAAYHFVFLIKQDYPKLGKYTEPFLLYERLDRQFLLLESTVGFVIVRGYFLIAASIKARKSTPKIKNEK